MKRTRTKIFSRKSPKHFFIASMGLFLAALIAISGLLGNHASALTPPTLVGTSGNTWTSVAGGVARTTGSLTWEAGDVIVVMGVTENNTQTFAIPTATGLTFSLITTTNVSSTCKGYAWSATATNNGSGTINSDTSSSGEMANIEAYVYRGSDGVGNNAASAAGTGTTISLSRSSNNSAVAWAGCDYSATNDTVVTPTPAGGTQDQAAYLLNDATMFAFHWDDQGAAGSTNYGVTGFAGGVFTKVAVEIKGTSTKVTRQTGFPVNNFSATSRNSITQAVTVNSGSNSILVVRTAHEDAGGPVTGITFNGDALTKLDSVNATTWSRTEIWYLLNPDVTTANVVATKTASAGNRWGITVDVYDNVNPSSPWGATIDKAAADTGTSDTRTAGTFAAGDMTIDTMVIDSTGHSPQAGTALTKDYGTLDFGTSTTEAQGAHNTTNGVMAWTWTNSFPFSHIAAVLKAAPSNIPPAAPTLNLPVANAANVSTTPQFQLRTADAEGDYLQYKIDVCSTSDCSSIVRTIDQTSSQAGWTGQDQQTGTAYTGSASIGSSTMATHNYQSPALSANTQYWWRAYAIDPAGGNAFGAASSIQTFITSSYPSTGVLDAFTRANSSSLGSNWTADTMGIGGGGFAINGNAAANTNSLYSEMWWNPNTFGPDSEVYLSLAALPNGSNPSFGMMIRVQSPGNGAAVDGYRFQQILGTNSADLVEVTNGAETVVTSASNTAAVGDKYGLEARGNTINAYKYSGGSWTLLFSYTDVSAPIYNSAGNIGMWAYNGGSPTQSAVFDDFGGGTIISGSIPAAPTLVSPVGGVGGVPLWPRFDLRATDAEGDYLQYKIDLCSTSNCSSVISTIDQTSFQTGWASQDRQSAAAYAGGVTLSASTIAVHIYQGTALAPNTQYWWRAYAIDPGGSNTFSSASSIATFTTGLTEVRILGGTSIQGGTKIAN